MMNIFLLIILQTTSLNSFKEVSDHIDRATKYSELIAELEKNYGVKLNEDRLIVDLSRAIGFGLEEIRIGFQPAENDYYFHISAVVEGDILIAVQLLQTKKDKVFIKDEQVLVKYLESFNEMFLTDKGISDVEEEFWNWHMFSNGCGFSGEPTAEWELLEQFRITKNYQGLRKMLTSLNPEIQTYGLIGLLQLKHDGVSIEANDEKILSYLATRNSDIYTCVGCFPGEIYSTEKLLEYYAK